MERKCDIGHEIHAVSNLLGRKVEAGRRERGMENVSPMQIWIIRYLHDHREVDVFQKDIERDFTITRSTVTGILKLMEKNGYIVRKTVPEDARLKKLVLTEKGDDILHGVCDHIKETERMLLRGFSEEEVEMLRRLLEKLKKNLL